MVVSFRTDSFILGERSLAPTELETGWATKPIYALWKRKIFLVLTFSG